MEITDTVVNLVATGDIMLGGTLSNSIKEEKFIRCLDELNICFRDADIIFGNLEAPIYNGVNLRKNKILLCQSKKTIEILKHLGYNVLSIGNNHIMDYGQEGLNQTIDTLEENRIKYVGAGSSILQARKPVEFAVKGLRLFFLSYTSPTTDESNPLVYAQDNKSGISPYSLDIIKDDITAARLLGADIIVLSLHWGKDRYRFPYPQQQKEAHKIIDMGADIILGHHPHMLQGIERYKNGVIAYSLGNFIFGEFYLPNGRLQRWGTRHRLTACIKFKINRKRMIDYTIQPLWIDRNLIPHILGGREKIRALSEIERYSRVLESLDYTRFWKKILIKETIEIILDKIRSRFSKLCDIEKYYL